LADKVVLEPDPQLEGFSYSGIVEITTKRGEKFRRQVLQPKGHPMNPMTDADVEEKFRSMAGKFMGEKQIRQVIDTINNLDAVDNIGELIGLLVIPEQVSKQS
jgi:2-methylcitrate dehydratase